MMTRRMAGSDCAGVCNLINTHIYTRIHLCRQGVALAGTCQLRSQGLVPVHAHRTGEEVIGSEGRKGANGVGGGIGVGGGNGNEGGEGTGTEQGVEVNERAQYGNEDGSGDEATAGTGTGVETRGRT